MKKFQFLFIRILPINACLILKISIDISIRPMSRTIEYKGNYFI